MILEVIFGVQWRFSSSYGFGAIFEHKIQACGHLQGLEIKHSTPKNELWNDFLHISSKFWRNL